MSRKSKIENAEAQKDELPAAVEDSDGSSDGTEEAAPQKAAAEDAEPAEATKPDEDEIEDKRAAAYRRYRELRAAALAKPQEDAAGDDAGVDDAAGTEPEDAGEPDKPVAAKAKPAAKPEAADTDPLVDLKVNGEVRKVRLSEALAKAQIAIASENILEEVKALRQEARAQRGESKSQEHQPADRADLKGQDDRSQDDPAKADQQKPKIDPAKLEEIVERIQIGDRDEGRQAIMDLVGLMESGKGQQFDPKTIGPVVQEYIAQVQFKSEIEQATNEFKTKYARIIPDQEMLAISVNKLDRELREDLVKSGVAADQLAKLGTDQLMEVHQRARMGGAKLRSYSTLLEKVGSDMLGKYGKLFDEKSEEKAAPSRSDKPPQPQPSATAQQRIERKRAAAQQPRAAGMRSAIAEAPRPKTKAEIVAEMARKRGFQARQ